MTGLGTVFVQSVDFIDACYIVAFGLMIYGMMGLTGPRTAVRGNQIAAAGMAVAVVATLLRQGEFDGSGTVVLIIVGVAIGTAVGIPAARNVKMTAMPQMVALFNGVGGGAVALIAWVEYRHAFGGDWTLRSQGFELFGAIVGSISFWGSGIAFGLYGRCGSSNFSGSSLLLPRHLALQFGCLSMLIVGCVLPAERRKPSFTA